METKKIKITMLICMMISGITELKAQNQLEIYPINHGSLVMTFQGKAFYVDPVGDTELYKNYPDPTFVLITDIHGDHLSLNTLKSLNLDYAEIVAP